MLSADNAEEGQVLHQLYQIPKRSSKRANLEVSFYHRLILPFKVGSNGSIAICHKLMVFPLLLRRGNESRPETYLFRNRCKDKFLKNDTLKGNIGGKQYKK